MFMFMKAVFEHARSDDAIDVVPSAEHEARRWYARIDFMRDGKPVREARVFIDQPQPTVRMAYRLACKLARAAQTTSESHVATYDSESCAS